MDFLQCAVTSAAFIWLCCIALMSIAAGGWLRLIWQRGRGLHSETLESVAALAGEDCDAPKAGKPPMGRYS